MRPGVLLALLLTATALPALGQQQPPADALPRTPGTPYAARGLPDRIVLTPGADPAHEMAVAFRTDASQADAEAELAPALGGPTLEEVARRVGGTSRPLSSANGPALYHQVRFTGLSPDTAYAYRVKGAAGWSEWLQFRTAAPAFAPFRFLYLGDTQSGILAYGARTIRQAFSHGDIRLVLHAGDLVDQGPTLDHDDEWGEWSQAGGYNYAMVPQLPAAGNHDYVDRDRRLGPYWLRQFALPGNGVPGLEATTYYIDFQGVRFVVLDGTAGIALGTATAQARWLDHVLATSNARWNVVLFHQALFSCARFDDAAALRAAWQPIFKARRVDLVLQGHGHCYSRRLGRDDSDAALGAFGKRGLQPPVYIASMAGAKMLRLGDDVEARFDRIAQATQLYQIVDVEAARLRFRAYTPDGALYDGFDLLRDRRGRRRLKLLDEPLPPVRRCHHGVGPDGGTCAAPGGG